MKIGEVAKYGEFDIKGVRLINKDGSTIDIKDNDAVSIVCLISTNSKIIYQLFFSSDKFYDNKDLLLEEEITITTKDESVVISKENLYYNDLEKNDKNNRYCVTLTLK